MGRSKISTQIHQTTHTLEIDRDTLLLPSVYLRHGKRTAYILTYAIRPSPLVLVPQALAQAQQQGPGLGA
ncbi:hypothetical protein IAQ61_000882 [Plenodomus lingam]|uniref:uncharacterized protein n=1 Tax=Leptosphaeria maculans TaxID=5022 RepID=UPI00331DC3F4|nr:hypothetical protein IAQ61_000882 [Plenodomus lingam]